MDSRIIGDYMGDDIGDDIGDLVGDLGDMLGDSELAALVGEELGRRRRRRRRHGHSQVNPALVAAAARRQQLQALNARALQSGKPETAGHFVADPGQRELYIPFSEAVTLENTAGVATKLTVNVQRPMTIKRIVLAAGNTALPNALDFFAVTGVFIGVQPIFNADGVSPALAFAYNAVGVATFETNVARVGQIITCEVQRLFAQGGVDPVTTTISGFIIGKSAEV